MFPFDQPPPTALYLALYLGTLVGHVVPMNYVLAGSTYLAAVGLWEAARGRLTPPAARIAGVLRDWMPFALGIAITAGVAPILFIQVLYKEPFYTANLLLFHRWMSILPVLIVAFYLLYLQKSKRYARWPAPGRAAVTLGVLLCFGFVAWSWTENHLLSTRDASVWVEQYVRGGWFYGDPELPPRLALWYVGAFPTLAMLLAWQAPARRARRTLAYVALLGLVGAAVAGVVYAWWLPAAARSFIWDAGAAYAVAALVGWLAQAGVWAAAARGARLRAPALVGLTVAVVVTTTAMTVLRELRRLAAVDIDRFYEEHAAAGRVGGFVAFLLFLTLNAALIALVIVIVNRSLRRARAAPEG